MDAIYFAIKLKKRKEFRNDHSSSKEFIKTTVV